MADIDFDITFEEDEEVTIIKPSPTTKKSNKASITRSENKDLRVGITKNNDGNRCVDIHEFDLNKMHPIGPDDVKWGTKTFIIGKPGTGKSKIIEAIMVAKAWFIPCVQAFSESERENHFYKEHMDDIFVFNKYDPEVVKKSMERQSLAKKNLKNPWLMNIFDDAIIDPTILKKPPMPALFKLARHWNEMNVFANQRAMDLPPVVRVCLDYIFLLANSATNDRKVIYENFIGGLIPTFKDFEDLFDALTADHCAMVIDNTSTSSILSDRIFYFKADLDRVPKDFKMGSKDAHDFNDERIRKDLLDDDFKE